jgi:hypothetical protein
MNTAPRKLIPAFMLSLALFAAVVATPAGVSAQVGKSCTTDAECAGPNGACVNNPLGENTGTKACRNYLCDTTKTTTIRILDANNAPVAGSVLKRGQFVEITSHSKVAVNNFANAFYNQDNLYGPGNPKGFETTSAHMARFGKSGVQLTNGNFHLTWGVTGQNATTYTMKVPWDYFITEDLNPSANKMQPTKIQVNSYFGMTGPDRFSLPESACVSYFTVEADAYSCTTDAQCQAKYGPNSVCGDDNRCGPKPTVTAGAPSVTTGPSNATCPSNSACVAAGSAKACSCNAGFNNCDNNWANGCETQGKCPAGGVCSDNSQCASGSCKDHYCQPVTNPTKVPNGGTCTEDSQCASGNCENGKCTAAEPTKVPPGGACTEDAQCSSGYACQNNRCMPTYCDAAKPCPNGYTCKQGACFPGKCDDTNRCPTGYTCNRDGACMPGKCAADTPCPPGYVCQNDGSCKKNDGAGSCSGDADCKANGQCVNGSCFCKQGAYNCDRDWANGCEATSPCAGSGVAKVVIKLKFAGVGRNIKPVVESEKVKVTLANKYLQEPVEKTADFRIVGEGEQGIRIFEGTVDFGNIPLGDDYAILIKGGHHIQKRICDTNPVETADGRYFCTINKIKIEEGTNTFDFSKIYQLAGDLPVSNEQSGFVDSVDITYLRSNLGKKDAESLRIGDLNFDGIIDTQDYSLGLFSLSFKYDEQLTGDELQ